MLGMVKSCIGTKFTGQFGDLIAVSIFFISYKFLVKSRYMHLVAYHRNTKSFMTGILSI